MSTMRRVDRTGRRDVFVTAGREGHAPSAHAERKARTRRVTKVIASDISDPYR
jgi:hypothetical protein